MRLRLAVEVIGVFLCALSLGAIFEVWAGVGVVGVWLVYVARGE